MNTSLFEKFLIGDVCAGYQWNEEPPALCTIDYYYVRDGAYMYYKFFWSVWLKRSTSWYYNGLKLKFSIDGISPSHFTQIVKESNESEKGWSKSGETEWASFLIGSDQTPKLDVVLIDTNTNVTKMHLTMNALVMYGGSKLLSVSDFDVDGNIALSITREGGATKETLKIIHQYTLIDTLDVTNKTSVSLSSEGLVRAYNQMSNVKSAKFRFEFESFDSNNVSLGVYTVEATGSISNASPIFSPNSATKLTYFDANTDVTSLVSCILQRKSDLRVVVPKAEAKKGATIVKYSIAIGDDVVESDTNGTIVFGLISSSGNLKVKVTVFDSRGNTVTDEKDIEVIAYKPPLIIAEIVRKNNYEDETYLTVKPEYPSINNVNSTIITYKYAVVGNEYGDTHTITENVKYILSCDKTKAYNFHITVTDAFKSTAMKEFMLTKGEFPLFIDTGINAVGINAFPQKREALRVGNGVARFEDGIVLSSSTADSTKSFLLSVDDSGQLSIKEYN